MKIKPQIAIGITLAIFVLGIISTSVTGLWTTTSTKTPDKLNEPAYSDSYDPADIRGSYTFFEISNLYSVPLEDLATAFGVDAAGATSFKSKDLESIYAESEYEIGTNSIKMFVAFYLGLPFDTAEETYLPNAAAMILTEKGNMTQEQRDYLKSHTIPAA